MKVGETLSKAIKEGKWVKIDYFNKNQELTHYWIAVKDINIEKKLLLVDIFNDQKSLDVISDGSIFFDSIQSATIISFSSYDVPEGLINKIEQNLSKLGWLDYDHFNHNILNYYKECIYYDINPYQSNYESIPGIDYLTLRKSKKYILNEEQERKVISDIYHYDLSDKNLKYSTLAINILSIDSDNKKYVVAYYELKFDPLKKSLIIGNKIRFNESFMIEKRVLSLQPYINMDVEEFISNFKEKYVEYRDLIISNCKHNERIDEMPDIMLLEREITADVTKEYQVIEEEYQNNTMHTPLKSFFGNITKRNLMQKKEPSIIIYDKRININQMRVLYNAMKYPVTYVQGPPGTGKTQTIINVVLSGFYNDKTMLICSSNNKPVDGIIDKLVFTYRDEKINFPYLRLGNNAEIAKTTSKIYELMNYETQKVVKENLISKIKDDTDNNIKKLLKLLEKQERRNELEDKIFNAQRLIRSLEGKRSKLIDNINKTVTVFNEELSELPEVSNEEVLDLFTPLKDDYKLSQFLYFKSLSYIQKLKMPRYKELAEICSLKEADERVKQFNSWISSDDNMKLLSDAFPVIFSTNVSSNKLGSAKYKFDLVIMDEAGQCNVATSLIPIVRATNLLLVGDPNQLRPVIVMSSETNDELMKKYDISEEYNYKEKSILDTMTARDNISKYILLKYHYRCGKNIINYSNMRYYNNSLNLDFLERTGELEFIDVKNENIEERNSAYDEAKAIVDYIKRNNLIDVSIITPFVNQKELINDMLIKENLNHIIKCGTIHSIQGGEKNTIIFSPAISLKSSRKTYDWIKNNHELINVAITRAKDKFIIAGDQTAINAHSEKNDDLFNLIQYVLNKGKIVIPPSENIKIEIGKSNGSKNEEMFFETISQFCSTHKSFEAERNVKLKKLFKDDPYLSNTEYEFDLVLFNKNILGKKGSPAIAFEVNGGEHLGTLSRERSDRLKMEICRKKGIKLIFIPNEFVKAYEYISEVIIDSKDGKYEKVSLFD